ncbi:MAG: twin-arginine translocation signal domain-containing protein [Phycisphaerales bacterium]|nr:twin-arginine translocation signal domain-containing protein [Phycisphaerales bacterium]
MSQAKMSRRGFLKKTTATLAGTAAAPYLIPSSALGLASTVAPSNRITLGLIGCGIHGAG